ncbi:hypothetical protein FOB58_000920 [Candida parapsilosis]|uniref:Uncharacterized protein n=2 Tax=Candida parapsilosis TaxID=5480 RepID=G8BG70_CANPC|nr:uncharacterized protein CPAR2_204970 [Candida parapsilosis]KAF6054998.1 hypothetical protein FOB58_000920 [Candida parapsilosis]KAF6055979.1 hypothetical protein FOB59_000491 [Candida parapsilosis]KAF6058909.1 hypothetical protein FOB60_000491 [Candida parapsilosis]KAF6067666.1 hypothetical protein FOB61_000491 [Candida parapsilosis]KAI5901895.1 hypothetical protein K4G60_g1034 [Candida parapsilosis]
MAGLLDLLNADEILNRQQQQREKQTRGQEDSQAHHQQDLHTVSHNHCFGSAQYHDQKSPRAFITPPPTYSWKGNSTANFTDPLSSIKSENQLASSMSSINSSPIELERNMSMVIKQESTRDVNTAFSSVSPQQPCSPSKLSVTETGLLSSFTPKSVAANKSALPSDSHKPLFQLRDKIPKSKINKRILANKRFVKFAIRRKYSTKKKISDTRQSKLHIKSLKAGIKIKLTKCDDLFSLYHCLIPFTDERKIYSLFKDDTAIREYNETVAEYANTSDIKSQSNNNMNKCLVSKGLQLIDNNVVDLTEYSNKIIKSFTSESNQSTPTFNSLDTAVNTLFNSKEFTLVRITRSTTDDIHGSSILKLETATPGDYTLIDDEENSDEMLHSLGNQGEVPNNLFFKKIIARPRYKSNMKIYFIPCDRVNYSLYTDCRSFERDLFNGILQVAFEDLEQCLCHGIKGLDKVDADDVSGVKRVFGFARNVYCTFPVEDALKRFKLSLIESLKSGMEEEMGEDDVVEEANDLVRDIPTFHGITTPQTQTLPPPQVESPLGINPIQNQTTPQQSQQSQQQRQQQRQQQHAFNSLQSPQYPVPSSIPQPPFASRSFSFDGHFGGKTLQPHHSWPQADSKKQSPVAFVNNSVSPRQQGLSYPPPPAIAPTTKFSSIDVPRRLSLPQQPLRSLAAPVHNEYVQLPPLVTLPQTPRTSIIKEDHLTFSPVALQQSPPTQSYYSSRILPPLNTMSTMPMPRGQYFHFQPRS